MKKSKKIRYAVVGLGDIAQRAILPAFKGAKNSELVALVSGDSKKLKHLGRKYKVPHLFSYDDYDRCLTSGWIDAVFIALPNNLHAEYAIRAAHAGLHVLCEKPLAITSEECQEMIDATRRNHVKLMTAYRLHFEPANLKAIELIRKKKIGEPLFFDSAFGFLAKAGNIRLDAELGGGPLHDIGVYCINAMRYLFQDEPTEVFAFSTNTGRKRFDEVEETVNCVVKFPENRLASFTVSFGSSPVAEYCVVGTKGDLVLKNAYEWTGGKEMELTVKGKTTKDKFKPTGQFAAELLYFSDCILKNREPEPNGEEGLADIRVVEAIAESLRTGQPVKVERTQRRRRPTLVQRIQRRPQQTPKPFRAEEPQDEVA